MSAAKAVGGLVVLAAVVGGGLYAGDRYAEGRAEEYVAGLVASKLTDPGPTTVDIKGFPFLTQVARGSLDEVTASVHGATLNGLPVSDLDMDVHGVPVRAATGQPATARDATVSATVPTASIEQAVRRQTGLTVSLAVTGSDLAASGNVLGLPLQVTLAPRVDAGRLLTDVEKVSLGGRDLDPASLPSVLRDRLRGIEIPVDALPFGLKLGSAAMVPAGVRITATGTDVAMPTAG